MTEDCNTYHQLVDIILNEDDDAVSEFILVESERDTVLANLSGDTTLMNYMFLFEEFLEQHDLYLFKGWDKAAFVGQPRVEKFWITFHLLAPEGTDLRGAKRISDAVSQGEVKAKKLSTGGTMVRFMVLKRSLDQLEADTKEKIEKLSDKAMDEL